MKKINKFYSFKFIWGLLMGVIFFTISALLVFSPIFVENDFLPKVLRIFFAIIFFLYGFSRIYRAWKQ